MKDFKFICFLSLFILVFYSCEFNRSEKTDISTEELFNNAENEIKKNPNSVLVLTNTILKSSKKQKLNDEQLIHVYKLRQEAFSNLQNMDSVLSTGKQIRAFAEKIDDSLAIANSLLLVKGDIDFSEQQVLETYLPSAIKTFKNNNMPFESAKLSATYGAILCHKGDFVNAQKILLDSYQVLNKLDSIKSIVNVCMNIGNAYSYTKSTKKSLEYYKKAYEAALKVKDSNSISSVLMNIGTFYVDDIKDQDKALDYYYRALQYVSGKSGAYLKMKIDYNVAVATFAKGDLISSEHTFQSMLADCIKIEAYEGVAMASKGLGDLYIKKQQPDKALPYLTRAIHLADSLDMSFEALQMQPSLLALYKKNKNFEAALRVSEQMKISTDSLLSLDKQKALHELEIKYETSKKEEENKHLLQVLGYKQKTIVILFLLFFFAAGLVVLYRQRSLFLKERNKAYDILMGKYRLAKEENTTLLETKAPVLKENLVYSEKLKDKMREYFVSQKPYLNPKLKLEDIVLELGVPKKEITQLLKQEYGFNFNTYVNSFRVEELKQLFSDPAYANFKIESVAEKAGFGSKQSFYNAFETFTGVKPNYFRSQIAEKVISKS
nr:helix-turn-helix domain-containing protein [uncultured Flavobacterium sp.]